MPPLGTSSSPRLRLARASSRVAFRLLSVATAARRLAIWLFDVLDGVLELEAIGPRLGHLAAHLGLGGRQVRFGRVHGGFLDRHLNLVRLLVELDQHVALFHAVVVVHQDLGHLAGHARSHEGHVAVDVGVIGGNRVQRRYHPGHQEVCRRPPGRPRPPPGAAISAGGAREAWLSALPGRMEGRLRGRAGDPQFAALAARPALRPAPARQGSILACRRPRHVCRPFLPYWYLSFPAQVPT